MFSFFDRINIEFVVVSQTEKSVERDFGILNPSLGQKGKKYFEFKLNSK